MVQLVKPSENNGIIGDSEPMKILRNYINDVAPSDATILILGESGVGKELVARAIHQNGRRQNAPFLATSCISFAESILESELFGHEKGAFTGAAHKKIGRFERAHGGTLFLDEIGELSPVFQVKLLRVLQESEFERVGGTETIKVDARIIAATNRDLRAGVTEGWFRKDLFYRLNVIPISVPSLKERKEDIPLLVEHFLSKFAGQSNRNIRGLTDRCKQALLAYDYPGNVRELENIIQRLVVLTKPPLIGLRDLPPELHSCLEFVKFAAPEVAVDTGSLFKALKRITVSNNKGLISYWHKGLRGNTIDDIHRYLVAKQGAWFSRSEFARYLERCVHSIQSKYKTAGVYLRILTANSILKHNGKKANRSAYRLDSHFLSANKAA